MTGELVPPGPSSGALALRPDQHEWTADQSAALQQLGLDEATPGDLAVFLHVCQRTGLDPFSRQIYMIKRWDGAGQRNRWTIQTGIDGFRVIAERRNEKARERGEADEYVGQVGPQWCGDDGRWVDVWVHDAPPVAARVGVLRRGWQEPVWATALFREYAQTNSKGELTAMWGRKGKPAHMIGKCAEALALRKAFPHDLAGLLTPEEAAREENEARGPRVVDAPPARPAASAADLTAGARAVDDPNGRMRPAQIAEVMRLLRDVDLADRWAWVSAELGRPVREWAAVRAGEADRLTRGLEQLRAGQAAAADPSPEHDDQNDQPPGEDTRQ